MRAGWEKFTTIFFICPRFDGQYPHTMSKNIIQEHTTLLKEFKSYLESQGTNEKKTEQHVKNAELFLNAFLAKKQGVTFAEGPRLIDNYFGDWFIRNAPTASETQIILSIASLKKLYVMLGEQGHITAAEVTKIENIMTSRKDDWKDAMDAYSEELAASSAEGGEEEEEGSSSPKWESKTAKFSSDDGGEEEVDISSGFIVEGGKSDDDDDDQKKGGAELLFGELDFSEFDEEESEEEDRDDVADDDEDDDEEEEDDDSDDDL